MGGLNRLNQFKALRTEAAMYMCISLSHFLHVNNASLCVWLLRESTSYYGVSQRLSDHHVIPYAHDHKISQQKTFGISQCSCDSSKVRVNLEPDMSPVQMSFTFLAWSCESVAC